MNIGVVIGEDEKRILAATSLYNCKVVENGQRKYSKNYENWLMMHRRHVCIVDGFWTSAVFFAPSIENLILIAFPVDL